MKAMQCDQAFAQLFNETAIPTIELKFTYYKFQLNGSIQFEAELFIQCM